MSRPADMLRFLGGPVTCHEVGWTGPWPPPKKMGLAVGQQTLIVKVFDPAEVAPEAIAALEDAVTIVVQVYERRNASRFTDADMAAMTHVFRGAEYVPIGEPL